MVDLLKKNKMFLGLLVYQVFSGLGGGIFQLFMLLSVHMLYGNPMYTGIASFFMMAPHLFSFVVGPFVDRSNKVSVMRITTLIEFVAVGLLVVLAHMDMLNVMFMFALILLYSITAVFEGPSGGAFLRKIVDKDELVKANSLISMAATAGGIAVAVILFRALGGDGDNVTLPFIYATSAVFLVLAVIVTFFLKDKSHKTETPENESKIKQYIVELKSGASFVRRTNFIFYFLIAGVAVAFFVDVAYTNMPEFATTHVGAQGYIILTVTMLAAGFLSSTLAGLMGDKFRIGMLTCIVWVAAGVLRIVYANVLPISLIYGLSVNFAYGIILGYARLIRQSLIQKSTPKTMIARVGTVQTTFIAAFGALGALAGGVIGSVIATVDHVFVLQGAAYVAIGLFMALIPSIRKLPKITEMKGAEDDEAVTETPEQ